MPRLDLPRHPFQLLDELLESARPRRAPRRSLPIEVLGRDDGLTLRALLPGLVPESIDVSLVRGELRIRADRRPLLAATDAEAAQPSARVISRELPEGPVDLRMRLGFRPNAEAVQAGYELGVLRIDVPRAAEERPRRIPVTTR